jgi:hypothetical protein
VAAFFMTHATASGLASHSARFRYAYVAASSHVLACERDSCLVGPKDASWPMLSCGNTAIKGWSWPNFWANVASFSPVAARKTRGSGGPEARVRPEGTWIRPCSLTPSGDH